MKKIFNVMFIMFFMVLVLSSSCFARIKAPLELIRKGDKLIFTGTAWTVYKTEDAAKNLNTRQISGYIRNRQVVTVQLIKGQVLKIGNNQYISYGRTAYNYFSFLPVANNITENRTLSYKIKAGDVSGNGLVNSFDAGLISKQVADQNFLDLREQIIADINNDGSITAADVKLAEKGQTTTRTITYVPGDLDGDKKATSADARLLTRYIGGLENFSLKQKLAADLDGDNKITSADSRLLTRYMCGLIYVFPIEGDLDGNGKLEQNDSDIALKATVGLIKLNDAQKRCADVDNDGEVTSSDSRIILRKI